MFSLLEHHSPLAGGFLTGKVTNAMDSKDESVLERTRWRGESALKGYVEQFDHPRAHEAIRKLQKACEAVSPMLTPAAASIRWLVHHSALGHDDGIILGATDISQLTATVEASKQGPLSGRLLDVMNGLAADARIE
jgi:aflatoxin B1 aldehyde reductase